MPRLDKQGQSNVQAAAGPTNLDRRRLPSSFYWLCIIGPTFGTLELLMLGFDLHKRSPQFLPILMAGILCVYAYLVYRTFNIVREGIQLRALLGQDQTEQKAKHLAQDFFRVTFGIGLAIAVLRLVLAK